MTNKHTKSVEEEVRRIKSSLLILAYAIEEGRIDGIIEEITQSFQYAETLTPTPPKEVEEIVKEFETRYDVSYMDGTTYGVADEFRENLTQTLTQLQKDADARVEEVIRDFEARCEHPDHTISQELKEETIHHLQTLKDTNDT